MIVRRKRSVALVRTRAWRAVGGVNEEDVSQA